MPVNYQAGDTGVNELYEKRVYRRATQATCIFNESLGLWGKPGSGKPFIIKNDFQLNAGRRIECRILGELTGDGYTGQADLTGLETGLPLENFKFQISTIKSPPLKVEDEEDEQAVSWNIDQSFQDATADWWSRVLEAGAHMQLAGATFTSALDYYKPNGALIRAAISSNGIHPHVWTLGNPSLVPSTNRHLLPGAVANAESLGSSNVFDTAMLNKMISHAEGANPPILPCKIFGTRAYLVFVHGDCWGDLFASSGQYEAVSLAMLEGGLDPKRSGFLTGGLKPWRNCIFIQSRWNPPAQHSSTAAALANTRKVYLVGQNALTCGWGKGHSRSKVKITREPYNLGAWRFGSRMLFGGQKVYWTDADSNLRDNAVVVGSVYAANTGDAS